MEKIKILALSKYSYEGPSSRYRFYNYKQCFEENGIDMDIYPLFNKNYFTAKNSFDKTAAAAKAYIKRVIFLFKILFFNSYDLLLIEYELLPYFPAIFEKLLKLRGIKYIVDYDDAIFHRYDMSSNLFIKKFLSKKIANVIKNASAVIACNSYLENYAAKYNKKIYRLPTVVLIDRYIQKCVNYDKKESKNFIVGWIGSKSTSVYILEILDVFKEFKNKFQNVQFNLIGFDKSLLSEEKAKEYGINIIPWSEESEIENILEFDAGIMPLHNDPWSQGKCGFKLIQYMSCKKPVIASPVGINCEIVQEDNGFLVSNNKEWLEALEKLYLNKELRVKMSNRNFKKILNLFNNNKNCKSYIKIIKELIITQ